MWCRHLRAGKDTFVYSWDILEALFIIQWLFYINGALFNPLNGSDFTGGSYNVIKV